MQKSSLPWVIKHRPKRINEVVNQEEAKKTLISWIEEWLSGRPPKQKAALLYGPPGIGKTSLIEAIADEFDLQVLELNASDYRRKSDIERTVGIAASKKSLTKRGLIILMDEVDGINPKADEGGLETLIEIIKRTRNPIVMTANDPWKESLKTLRDGNLVLMVEFKSLKISDIMTLLQRICDEERLQCDGEALRYIAEKSEGDARAAINDLQALAEGYGKVTIDLARLLIRGREKSIDIWRTLNSIIYADKSWKAKSAVAQSEVDYEELLLWLSDNVSKKYTDPLDLFRALDALSRATIHLARAKRTGEWSMLSYVFDMMGPGVALAKSSSSKISPSKYAYPEKLKLAAQLKNVREVRERLVEHLSYRMLASKKLIKSEVLPFLFIVFRNVESSLVAARLAIGYGLDMEKIKLLAGPNAENVINAIEKLKRARETPQVKKPQQTQPKPSSKTG
ncbi:MAG: replication factor C large subunit, partial [Acidilobaceae archaeon]